MRIMLLLPLGLLALSGCVDVHEHRNQPPSSTTYVTPAEPGPATSTTTVIRSP